MTDYSKISIAAQGILKQIELNSTGNVFVVRQIDVRDGSGADPKSLTHTLMAALVATAADGGFASQNDLADYALSSTIGTLDATPTNYTPTSATVGGHLEGIDSAIVGAGGYLVKVSAADTTAGYLNTSITAGSGLSKTITNPAADEVLDLAVNVDGSTLEINADALRIKDGGVNADKLSSSVVDPLGAILGGGGTALQIKTDSTTLDINVSNELRIKPLGVDTAQIKDDAVTTAKITDLHVTTAKINDLAVTNGKLDAQAVSAEKILNNTITAAQMANNSIGSNQLSDNSVITVKINNLAVTTAKIDDLAVTTGKMALGSVDETILSNSVVDANGAISGGGGIQLSVNVDDITIEKAANALQVKDSGIDNNKLADDAVTNSKVSSSAAIDLSKLAATTASKALVSDGSGVISASSVTSTELGYVSGVTSAIQTQFTGKQSTSEKGQANGYASLDGGGKVPVSQLPNSIMEYQGTWNASTNSPTLADGAGSAGDVYRVAVAGSQFTPSITFAVGDYAIYNGTKWEKSDTTDSVPSVFGRTGDVSAQSGDYTAAQITNTPAGGIAATTVQAAINELDSEKFNSADFNSSFDTRLGTKSTTNLAEGSNLYFTDERAQDAIGTILADSATIDFTYNDGTPDITAIVKTNSISESHLTASVAGAGMTGGNGTALTIGANADGSITVNADDIQVAYSPAMRMILTAGEGFSANITYFVRWAITGETAGRVYKADKDAASTHKFYAFGTVRSGSAVSAGDSVTVNIAGTITLGSGDTNFASGDVGKAVYLTAAGAFSVTAPTATDEAVFRVGIVQEVSKIYLGQYQLNYIN